MSRLTLDFHRVEGGAFELGWRADSLPPDVQAQLREYSPEEAWLQRVSPRRQVRGETLEEAYLRPVRLKATS